MGSGADASAGIGPCMSHGSDCGQVRENSGVATASCSPTGAVSDDTPASGTAPAATLATPILNADGIVATTTAASCLQHAGPSQSRLTTQVPPLPPCATSGSSDLPTATYTSSVISTSSISGPPPVARVVASSQATPVHSEHHPSPARSQVQRMAVSPLAVRQGAASPPPVVRPVSPGGSQLASSSSLKHLSGSQPPGWHRIQWAKTAPAGTAQPQVGVTLGINLSGSLTPASGSMSQRESHTVTQVLRSPRGSRTSLSARSEATPTGKQREIRQRVQTTAGGPPPSTGSSNVAAAPLPLSARTPQRSIEIIPVTGKVVRYPSPQPSWR